jgi:hypothetical protein
MHNKKNMVVIAGVIFFGFLSFITGNQKAEAEVLSFDFTYTSNETLIVANCPDTILFDEAWLKNTGTDPDSYAILMTVNLSNPPQWTELLCCGGLCHPEGKITDTVYVAAGDSGLVGAEIEAIGAPGDGIVTITITSRGNPNLSDSLTFHLAAHAGCVPMTDKWGLLILISLLFLTGLYLIRRRLRLATTG